MKTSEEIIRAEGVEVTFGEKTVVRGVDLSIYRGEIFVLLGPSGCGKTTFLKCLMGLWVPTRGSIFLLGQDIVRLSEKEMDEVRLKMGVSFQTGALFNSMTLLENVCLPLFEKTKLSRKEVIALARMKLEMVGLLDAVDKLPSELSGGMRKRASIARALALEPEIIFFDEPTSGLDPLTSAGIDKLIRTLNRSFGVTVFAVTHEIASAFAIGDRIGMMSAGRLIDVQEPKKMKNHSDAAVVDFLERRPPAESRGHWEDYVELEETK